MNKIYNYDEGYCIL